MMQSQTCCAVGACSFEHIIIENTIRRAIAEMEGEDDNGN